MPSNRKLVVQQWVTVDNIAAEEDGGLSFVSGEPFSETDTTRFKEELMGFIDSVDTMILDATTYAQSAATGPTPTTKASTDRSSTTSRNRRLLDPGARPVGRLPARNGDAGPGRHDRRAQGATRQGPLAGAASAL